MKKLISLLVFTFIFQGVSFIAYGGGITFQQPPQIGPLQYWSEKITDNMYWSVSMLLILILFLLVVLKKHYTEKPLTAVMFWIGRWVATALFIISLSSSYEMCLIPPPGCGMFEMCTTYAGHPRPGIWCLTILCLMWILDLVILILLIKKYRKLVMMPKNPSK